MSYSPLGALAVLAAAAGLVGAQPATPPDKPAAAQLADWPSYNRTLTSERFAALSEIGRANVAQRLCHVDVGGAFTDRAEAARPGRPGTSSR